MIWLFLPPAKSGGRPRSTRMMSRTLGVSRSGFYAWHSRPPSARSWIDDTPGKRIAAIHKASKETCGARRIHAGLADEDIKAAKRRGIYKGRPLRIDMETIKERFANGLSPTEIARDMGISRDTVYKARALA